MTEQNSPQQGPPSPPPTARAPETIMVNLPPKQLAALDAWIARLRNRTNANRQFALAYMITVGSMEKVFSLRLWTRSCDLYWRTIVSMAVIVGIIHIFNAGSADVIRTVFSGVKDTLDVGARFYPPFAAIMLIISAFIFKLYRPGSTTIGQNSLRQAQSATLTASVSPVPLTLIPILATKVDAWIAKYNPQISRQKAIPVMVAIGLARKGRGVRMWATICDYYWRWAIGIAIFRYFWIIASKYGSEYGFGGGIEVTIAHYNSPPAVAGFWETMYISGEFFVIVAISTWIIAMRHNLFDRQRRGIVDL